MSALPQSCRARLQRRDFEFLVKVLAKDDARMSEGLWQLLGDRDSLAQILDQPEILQAILELTSPLGISPELYFYVLVRHALMDASIECREVADYVGATLAVSAYGCSRVAADRETERFTYHVDFMQALDQASAYDRFFLQVRCGNQFMILTGLFPKFIRHRRDRHGAPGVRYYESVASNAFLEASAHPLADEFDLASIYHVLGETIRETRQALNYLADHYLFLDT